LRHRHGRRRQVAKRLEPADWSFALSTTSACRRAESQRDSGPQPRVARHELPWEMVREIFTTLKGLQKAGPGRTRRPDLLQPLQG
jgi:hypothetical protein